jgi:hypothetical protein
MAEYYLISQLPSLDGIGDNASIPITQERFLELCNRFLSKKALLQMNKLTLTPPLESEKSTSALIEAWNDGERNLRLVLGKARADKMNKVFDLPKKDLPIELFKVASAALEIDNPLEAEKFLLQYRLSFLERIRPMDNFSLEFIFYYALKLMLLSRIRNFDENLGKITYKNIYSSILNGEQLEAKR